jgi:hypothetical protein
MATSQNGWPVVPDTTAGRAKLDRGPLIRDITVPNGVLAGDVAVVFRWLAREYDQRVEHLDRGECWGWFVKKIEGSDTYSNHASGCAVDFNAPDNPMGVPTTRSLTAAQIAECHELERESGGVLRWGGDFSRPDPMHWEIIGTPAQVAALADRLKEQPMSLDAADKAWISAELAKLVTLASFPTGGGSGSPVGNAALGQGWPLEPGQPRTADWANMQQIYLLLKAVKGVVDDIRTALPGPVGAQLNAILSGLDQLTADPAETGFAHPTVAAAEYAESHEPPA